MKSLKIIANDNMNYVNFLHGEILQKLLALKNIVFRLSDSQTKDNIMFELDNLNQQLRNEIITTCPLAIMDGELVDSVLAFLDSWSKTHLKEKKVEFLIKCEDELSLPSWQLFILFRLICEINIGIAESNECKKVVSTKIYKEADNIIIENNYQSHKPELLCILNGTLEIIDEKTIITISVKDHFCNCS